ncbi:hypothetical protein ACJX0J_039558, partial [Zea mays]
RQHFMDLGPVLAQPIAGNRGGFRLPWINNLFVSSVNGYRFGDLVLGVYKYPKTCLFHIFHVLTPILTTLPLSIFLYFLYLRL